MEKGGYEWRYWAVDRGRTISKTEGGRQLAFFVFEPDARFDPRNITLEIAYDVVVCSGFL